VPVKVQKLRDAGDRVATVTQLVDLLESFAQAPGDPRLGLWLG
jgi:hypothetical protein